MKTPLTTAAILVGLLLSIAARAQDTIITYSGQKIPAKVLLITDNLVIYEEPDGKKAVIARANVQFTKLNGSPDYHTSQLEKPIANPVNNKNVAGIYLQSSANNQTTSLVLYIVGALVAGVGTAVSNDTFGVYTSAGVGGAISLVGFGFHIKSISDLRKAGRYLEGSH